LGRRDGAERGIHWGMRTAMKLVTLEESTKEGVRIAIVRKGKKEGRSV
jgi:hypothetical protein